MDFDKIIDRRGTGCIKFDDLESRFGKKDLIPMWIADMDFEVCPAIYEALKHRIDHKIYGYHTAPESYWQSIINWNKRRHGLDIAREELTYMPGIVRGLAYVLQYFTSKGDKVLIQQPVYHPFKHLVEGNGRVAVKNPLINTGNTMKMDLDLLERQIKEEKPKMMILCNPHNPGGVVWDVETLKRVATLCRENGVLVASDEIHGDVELFGNHYTSFAAVSEDAAQNSIVLGAPSKTFNIPGLISSWCVIKNKELRQGFYDWLAINEFNEPIFTVTVATEAAYNQGESWLNETLAYLEGNILALEEFVKEHLPCIKVMRPQASYLIWLDCTELGLKGQELDQLFIDAGLALNDGEMFGDGGEYHQRINIGCSRSVIIEALKRLERTIAQRK